MISLLAAVDALSHIDGMHDLRSQVLTNFVTKSILFFVVSIANSLNDRISLDGFTLLQFKDKCPNVISLLSQFVILIDNCQECINGAHNKPSISSEA